MSFEWNAMVDEWSRCQRCPMSTWAKNHVFGRGKPEGARICFIGEGPGRTEDEEGIPFVGQAGALLDRGLRRAKLPPDDYFITNLVCCRPSNSPKAPNRPPTDEEILRCLPRLVRTIDIVDPDVIVMLGKVPTQAWHTHVREALNLPPPDGVRFMRHPAYILRKGGESTPEFSEFLAELTLLKGGAPR